MRCATIVLPLLLLAAATAPVRAQDTELAAIPFESVPTNTKVVSSPIVLDGPTSVNGDLSLNDGAQLTFSPELNRTLHLGASDFVPFMPNGATLMANLDVNTGSLQTAANGTQFTATAPVHLPPGSTMTSFYCYLYDNDATINFAAPAAPSAAHAALYSRVAHFKAADAHTNLVLGTSGASTAMQTITSDPLGDVVIPAAVYYVVLQFSLTGDPATNENLRFYGCAIDYTIAAWGP